MKPIDRWIILFSGFRQDAGQRSGSVQAWRKLYQFHASKRCSVELHSWDASPRAIAHKIRNNSNGSPPRIVIGGYSFGGMTAANLAKQLQLCGLPVDWMVLADPVYRHSYYAGWWRSMVPWSRIEIPTNVRRVDYFLQRNNRYWPPNREGGWFQPAGHKLFPTDVQRTVIKSPVILEHDHSNMDDSREYHDALIKACEVTE